jgi:hypothetical protein
MKKHLLLLAFALTVSIANGQIAVPNGGFELWTSSTSENPENYPNNSNFQNFFYYQLPFNVIKSTDAYHGAYAIELRTVANDKDTSFGYFININPESAPTEWTGGMPYSEKPTGIRGYYKYNVASADSATIIVTFSKAGINIGTYFLSIGGVHSTYTLFDFTFNPALAVAPDSVSFGALSCKFAPDKEQPSGPAGSILIMDSVSFTGVISQPTLLNGDFELWESQTYDSPNEWIVHTRNGEGLNKTNDAYSGSYAIELKTYLGNQDGSPAAQQGYISTGYYPDNCDGNCQQMGGFPFTNQKDTLAFYYKYTPSSDDTASVSLNFKKNGVNIWGTGTNLLAAATYQYKEIPFDIGQSPDSVIIDILSSYWNHSALSYVGSTLIIDEIHFKATGQPTNIFKAKVNDKISISPNPSSGKFIVQGPGSTISSMEIYNEAGKKIRTISNNKLQRTAEINISDYPKGVYFIKVYEKGNVYTKKIVLQ